MYGQCLAVLIDPPGHFFARIGLSGESARWFSLPLGWDDIVEPSPAQYELEVLTATGWVERLRRLGAAPRELRQAVPQPPVEGAAEGPPASGADAGDDENSQESDSDDSSPTGATDEERRVLVRFARRAPVAWKSSPGNIAVGAWGNLLVGLLCGPGFTIFVVILLRVYPQHIVDPGALDAGLVFLAVMFATGIVMIGFGLRYLRIWRRMRRFRHEAPARVVGEVVAWLPYRDLWTPTDWHQRKETLISLRQSDGRTHTFRIPIRYMHRVRQRGAAVEIAYLPTTERVTDVTRLEEPAEAAASAALGDM